MNLLKTLFPLSFRFKPADAVSLVISIIIYLVVGVVIGWVIGLLSAIPVIGLIFGLVGGLIGLYNLVGIALAVLNFSNILK